MQWDNVRDTLKPNWSGWSPKRRAMRVPFPTPDGPNTTKGRVNDMGSQECHSQRDGDPLLNHVTLKCSALVSCLFVSFSRHLNYGGRLLQTDGESRPPQHPPAHSWPFQPVDFEGDVNLFHFVLLRCVGKGAFGKVPPRGSPFTRTPRIHLARSAWYNTSRPASCMHSSTSTNQSASR